MSVVAEALRLEGMNLHNNPLYYAKLAEAVNALKDGGKELAEKGFVSKKTSKLISQVS